MKRKHAIIAATLGAIGLTAAFAGLGVADSRQAGESRWAGMQMAHFDGHRGGWGGMGGRHGGARMMCSDQRDSRIGEAFDAVESFVSFKPEQTAAWEALKTAVRGASAKVGAACGEFAAGDKAQTAPQRLARMSSLLQTGLEVIEEVRPSFEAFYATLDERQKAAVDRMTSRRHHRS